VAGQAYLVFEVEWYLHTRPTEAYTVAQSLCQLVCFSGVNPGSRNVFRRHGEIHSESQIQIPHDSIIFPPPQMRTVP
jgi:hypothetical protein